MNQIFLLQSESINVLQCTMTMHSLNKTEQNKAEVLMAKKLLKNLKQILDATRQRIQGYLEHCYYPGYTSLPY